MSMEPGRLPGLERVDGASVEAGDEVHEVAEIDVELA